MSRWAGSIEVVNPFGDPHWILTDGRRSRIRETRTNEAPEPETSRWDRRCFSCKLRLAVARIGIHISSFRADKGRIQFSLLATSGMYRQLLQSLKQYDYDYEILSTATLPRANRTRKLTQNQLQSLRVALREGFFEYPRKTNLTVLGQILGCSPSTLCEILRRGEKAILGGYIAEHDGEKPQHERRPRPTQGTRSLV